MSTPPTKTCNVCGECFVVSSDHFHHTRSTGDGFMNTCKTCRKAHRKARYTRDKTKELAAQAVRYKDKKSKGLCVTCGKQALTGGVFCEYHWMARVARLYLDGSFTKALLEKAKKQKYRCPYTGEQLFPGINMSLDHKYPVSRFPERAKELSNVHWVSAAVNAAKSDLTEEEFFHLCEKVTAYRQFRK